MSLASAAQRIKQQNPNLNRPTENVPNGPYKPSKNLADEWPEVFERRVMPTQPRSRWDRGSGEAENIIFKDPRPDMAAEDPEENLSWLMLLAEAWKADQELAITLHGFRCQGCRLKRNNNGSYVMRPEISDRAWQSQEEYSQARDKYLVPHAKQLTILLKKLK